MKAAKMDDKCAHMVKSSSSGNVTQTKINKMNTTVFDSFTMLGSEVDVERINGGMGLIKHLNQQDSQTESKEVRYALSRLIRGLGSTKVFSRKGFYTTLTVYLTMHPETPVDNILSIMNTELRPMDSNSKSENAEIYTGQILLCGALIRSKLLVNSSSEVQLTVIENLINAGKQRSYLTFVSVSFLIEYFNQIEIASMKAIWPIIEQEFGIDWSKQSLHTFYVLLFLRDKFPTLANHKFMKKYLGHEELISKDTMENIVSLLTTMSKVISHHPVVDLFCKKLTTIGLVTDFCTVLDDKFVKPSKHDEQLTIRILISLLPNITDKSVLPSLLSSNFLQHMLKKCSNCKKNNDDEILVAFREFLQLVVSSTSAKDVKVKTQIAVLKRLILYPGDLMVERKTGVKVIQMITANLNPDGVKKLSKLYKDIIENKVPKGREDGKTEVWTNVERIYAGQMLTRLLGHPTVITEEDWRLEQLKLLFYHGLCEVPNVSVELAPQFRESFYRALDHKLPKLSDLRTLLSRLVHHIDVIFTESNIKLRAPLSDDAMAAWKKVVQLIQKLEKHPKRAAAAPVFHTLNLHLGLQLFSDTEMALPSISDLQSCYERLTKKPKKRTKMVEGEETDEEPEWIEVAVDLLLSLLSRNSHLLRSLVGCVFPHICPHLTPSAVYQILGVLDVNNDKGPLTSKDDSEDEDSDMECSDAEDGSDNEEDADNSQSDSGSESESIFEESAQEEEEETVTDRLRVALSQVLCDGSVQTDDEEINVDEIGEEEGKLLDEKLAAAFKILRENRRGRSKKQQKSAQALTHFRVRVVDLLDAYLESGPPMAIVIELIIPLFALLEFCIKDQHQKPLEIRVRSCLKKLSTVKKFKDTENVSDELLSTVMKALIEKGERSASVCQEMGDKLAECCTFLVRCVQHAGRPSDTLISVYKEHLKSFFKKRDCVLSATLFKSVLQLCWEGNWELAPMLVDFAFDKTVRPFRRGQALEFLTIFYRNNRLLRSGESHMSEKAEIEHMLCENTTSMFEQLNSIHKDKSLDSTEDGPNEAEKVKQKLICILLTLLHVVHAQHLPKVWNWQKIAQLLTEYRSRVSLAKDTKTAYSKLAKLIGAATNVKCKPATTSNGQADNVNEDNSLCEIRENGTTETDEVSEATSKKEQKKKKKSKSKQRDKQLLKKQSREMRINAMSEGLGSFNFSSVNLYANGTNKSVENGEVDSDHDMEQSASSSQKRSGSNESQHLSRKLKRKKYADTV